MARKLTAAEVRRVCDPDSLGFDSTQGLIPAETILGQDRALKALRFGLGIQDSGFNLYAAGLPGTGKMTAIATFLEKEAEGKEVPPDWCYVHNFQDPYRPVALRLKPGTGAKFQKDMKKLIESAQAEIRKAFGSEQYAKRRDAIAHEINEKKEQLYHQLNQQAHERGFAIQMSPMGVMLVPLLHGKPATEDAMLSLTPAERQGMTESREAVQEQITEAMAQVRGWDAEIAQEIEKLDREVVRYVLDGRVQELTKKYRDAGVTRYLKDIQEDIVASTGLFRSNQEPDPNNPFARTALAQALRRYEVNVLVDNSLLKGAPVVVENNPTFNNLVGRLEKEAYFGAVSSDFTMIRPGSLHRANGGYLVLRIDDVLRNVLSWDSLKRSLREEKVVIEDLAERFGFLSVKSIQPEPVPLDVKVILIGENFLYHTLFELDREFHELFKVKADFDSRMDRDETRLKEYAAALCTVCGKEGLRHLDKGAVARIVEYSSRLAEDQDKLSTWFAEIADVVREANYWAGTNGQELVRAEDITTAIQEKEYRSNLIQERIEEMIKRGTIKIETGEPVAGQVNGLSVLMVGDLYFGRPNRITASIGAGREGIVDIEREARLGGPIHTKGVLILSGLLTERYANNTPLSLSARLVFEQSYEEIEGDSASSAEFYALLSALAGIPINQCIAVTGSVNQKGEIQAVGGVNQKIEGFHDICKSRGLTGREGVVIPESNVHNLMLREDVVEAIQNGQFSVYSVATVDEGIECLTGIRPGARMEDGKFEEGSINRRVHDRLELLAKGVKEYSKEDNGKRRRTGTKLREILKFLWG
ncbi:MAG: AAA family ATPase [Dehalococcoidia bacterium]|nr:AAA family ATPase [Dehalococcoidia bacterium]